MIIPSPDGHDGFLLEFERINELVFEGGVCRDLCGGWVGGCERGGAGAGERWV